MLVCYQGATTNIIDGVSTIGTNTRLDIFKLLHPVRTTGPLEPVNHQSLPWIHGFSDVFPIENSVEFRVYLFLICGLGTGLIEASVERYIICYVRIVNTSLVSSRLPVVTYEESLREAPQARCSFSE